jgi:hypothetical protein
MRFVNANLLTSDKKIATQFLVFQSFVLSQPEWKKWYQPEIPVKSLPS